MICFVVIEKITETRKLLVAYIARVSFTLILIVLFTVYRSSFCIRYHSLVLRRGSRSVVNSIKIFISWLFWERVWINNIGVVLNSKYTYYWYKRIWTKEKRWRSIDFTSIESFDSVLRHCKCFSRRMLAATQFSLKCIQLRRLLKQSLHMLFGMFSSSNNCNIEI